MSNGVDSFRSSGPGRADLDPAFVAASLQGGAPEASRPDITPSSDHISGLNPTPNASNSNRAAEQVADMRASNQPVHLQAVPSRTELTPPVEVKIDDNPVDTRTPGRKRAEELLAKGRQKIKDAEQFTRDAEDAKKQKDVEAVKKAKADNKAALKDATNLFKQAVEADESFSEAWSELAASMESVAFVKGNGAQFEYPTISLNLKEPPMIEVDGKQKPHTQLSKQDCLMQMHLKAGLTKDNAMIQVARTMNPNAYVENPKHRSPRTFKMNGRLMQQQQLIRDTLDINNKNSTAWMELGHICIDQYFKHMNVLGKDYRGSELYRMALSCDDKNSEAWLALSSETGRPWSKPVMSPISLNLFGVKVPLPIPNIFSRAFEVNGKLYDSKACIVKACEGDNPDGETWYRLGNEAILDNHSLAPWFTFGLSRLFRNKSQVVNGQKIDANEAFTRSAQSRNPPYETWIKLADRLDDTHPSWSSNLIKRGLESIGLRTRKPTFETLTTHNSKTAADFTRRDLLVNAFNTDAYNLNLLKDIYRSMQNEESLGGKPPVVEIMGQPMKAEQVKSYFDEQCARYS